LAINPEKVIERSGVSLDKAVEVKENIRIKTNNKTIKDLTLVKINPLREYNVFSFMIICKGLY
jgi:hypothetical protein